MTASVTDPTKRFFRMDDGASYTVVAYDLKQAENILRSSHVEFGPNGDSYDEAWLKNEIDWEELPAERVDLIRVYRGEAGSVDPVPLSTCEVGEWFCSEW